MFRHKQHIRILFGFRNVPKQVAYKMLPKNMYITGLKN